MNTIEEAVELEICDIDSRPGLIAVLIHDPANVVLLKIIGQAYSGLDVSSGSGLYVIAGSSEWVPREVMDKVIRRRRRYSAPSPRSSDGLHITNMMVNPVEVYERYFEYEYEDGIKNLSEVYSVSNDQMPCLVFLNSVGSAAGITCTIDRDLININNDDLVADLSEIFQECNDLVKNNPFWASPDAQSDNVTLHKEIVEWRRVQCQLLEPILSSRRIFKSVVKNAPSIINVFGRSLSILL